MFVSAEPGGGGVNRPIGNCGPSAVQGMRQRRRGLNPFQTMLFQRHRGERR
jgi:hypothetical protein